MIEDDEQLEVTLKWIREFEDAIEKNKELGYDEWIVEVANNGLKCQIDQLEHQVAEYRSRNMRKLSTETMKKVLFMASEILGMHSEVVSNRCCEDWSGDPDLNPYKYFTKQELDDLNYNYEQWNSNGEDYDPEYNAFNQEGVLSMAISVMLNQIKI